MRSFLFATVLTLAACGGDEGDTIVQGSKDEQARSDITDLSTTVQTNSQDIDQAQTDISTNAGDIANAEADVSSLQADVADNSAAINQLNQSSALVIYDSTDQPIGRLLQLSTTAINANGSLGIGVTSEGFLFQIDFWASPQFWQSYDMYFESMDCTGTHLLLSGSITSPMRNLGAVLYDSNRPNKQLLYLPRKQTIRQNVLVGSYKKVDEDFCRSVSQQQDVMELYINDPQITGVTSLGASPHYIK